MSANSNNHASMEEDEEGLLGQPAGSGDKPDFSGDFSQPGRRSRKRTKQGIYTSDVTLEDLSAHFHQPASKACQELGMGLTIFKRVCRKLGLQRWPYEKPVRGEGGTTSHRTPTLAELGLVGGGGAHTPNLQQWPASGSGPHLAGQPPAFQQQWQHGAGMGSWGPLPLPGSGSGQDLLSAADQIEAALQQPDRAARSAAIKRLAAVLLKDQEAAQELVAEITAGIQGQPQLEEAGERHLKGRQQQQVDGLRQEQQQQQQQQQADALRQQRQQQQQQAAAAPLQARQLAAARHPGSAWQVPAPAAAPMLQRQGSVSAGALAPPPPQQQQQQQQGDDELAAVFQALRWAVEGQSQAPPLLHSQPVGAPPQQQLYKPRAAGAPQPAPQQQAMSDLLQLQQRLEAGPGGMDEAQLTPLLQRLLQWQEAQAEPAQPAAASPAAAEPQQRPPHGALGGAAAPPAPQPPAAPQQAAAGVWSPGKTKADTVLVEEVLPAAAAQRSPTPPGQRPAQPAPAPARQQQQQEEGGHNSMAKHPPALDGALGLGVEAVPPAALALLAAALEGAGGSAAAAPAAAQQAGPAAAQPPAAGAAGGGTSELQQAPQP